MAQTTVSSLQKALKYLYAEQRLLKQFNMLSRTWNLLSRNMIPAGGRGTLIVPIQTKKSEGAGGITEGGTLPTSRAPGTNEATFSLQEVAARYEVTWKSISHSRSSRYAFQRAVELLDEDMREVLLQDLSNELLDDGRGRLTTMPAADNTSPITVQLPIRARVGMFCDIMDDGDDDTKHLDSGEVTDVDYTNKTVTLSGTITGTAGDDYLVRQDTTDVSLNNALHLVGLTAIIDDGNPATVVGNYGGIDRTGAGTWYWKSLVKSASNNRPLSEDLLLEGILEARLRAGGKVDCFLTNPRIFQRYYDLLKEERTIPVAPTASLKGNLGPAGLFDEPEDGKTQFTFAGKPFHFDDFAPANIIFGLDKSSLGIAHGQARVPQPVQDTFGNPKLRDVANTASYEVAFWWEGQCICNAPGKNVKWEAIAET